MAGEGGRFNWGLTSLSIGGILDWPVSWSVAGLALGLGLGVTTASAWIMTLALVGTLANMSRHSPLERTEEWLFSTGPAFMMGWLLGFVIKGLAF